ATEPIPEPVAIAPAPAVAAVTPATDFVQPMANAGLDAVAAEELRILMDEQYSRIKRRRRRELVCSLVVFFGITGGGFGWFVSSPERVEAIRSAVKEVRSAGDIAGMVAKYQKALDQIGTRAQDIDIPTESMGVSANQEGLKDVHMDAEMKEMMGTEGKTVGERNRLLQEKFGSVKDGGLKAAVVPASKQQAPTAPKVDHSLSLQE
ncbi:MAG: hypothetical protein ACRCXD_02820, partial [Luteolibacter sp.]